MAIVLEEGHEALTIAKLAKSMKMAVGAMYRYFPSKASLIGALEVREVHGLAADLREAGARAEAAMAELEPGIRALIRGFASVRCYLRQEKLNPHRHRLIDATLSTPQQLLDDEQAEQVAEVVNTLLSLVAGPLDEAAAAGVLRPGDAMARTLIIWAATHGFDHLRKRDRTQPRHLHAAKLVEQAMIDLLRGWGATEATVKTVMGALHAS